MCDALSPACSTRSNGVIPAAISAWETCVLRTNISDVTETPIACPRLRHNACNDVA